MTKGAHAPVTVLDRIIPQLGFDPSDNAAKARRAAIKVHELRKEEARLLGELSAYRAQFNGGNASHYEHDRSSFLSELKMQFRVEAEKQKTKVTEGMVEEYAKGHQMYKAWLNGKLKDREHMHDLEAKLAQAQADIEFAIMERQDAIQAMRLDEEMVRFVRAEMGMS